MQFVGHLRYPGYSVGSNPFRALRVLRYKPWRCMRLHVHQPHPLYRWLHTAPADAIRASNAGWPPRTLQLRGGWHDDGTRRRSRAACCPQASTHCTTSRRVARRRARCFSSAHRATLRSTTIATTSARCRQYTTRNGQHAYDTQRAACCSQHCHVRCLRTDHAAHAFIIHRATYEIRTACIVHASGADAQPR